MPSNNEGFLLGESDPEISDLISHRALQHLGEQVFVVSIALKAIRLAIKFTPDLVLSNIECRV